MPHQIIQPPTVHATQQVGYSHVARVGSTLYIAGQVALDRDGNLVGEGDIEAQMRQVYANLRAICEYCGGSLASIVKLTTYLTDRAALAGFRKVRNETLRAPYPPNTLVFIDGLADPRYLVEIEAIAVVEE